MKFSLKNFPSQNLVNILTEWLRNPGKVTLESKNQKQFTGGGGGGGVCPRTPIEAYASALVSGNGQYLS